MYSSRFGVCVPACLCVRTIPLESNDRSPIIGILIQLDTVKFKGQGHHKSNFKVTGGNKSTEMADRDVETAEHK